MRMAEDDRRHGSHVEVRARERHVHPVRRRSRRHLDLRETGHGRRRVRRQVMLDAKVEQDVPPRGVLLVRACRIARLTSMKNEKTGMTTLSAVDGIRRNMKTGTSMLPVRIAWTRQAVPEGAMGCQGMEAVVGTCRSTRPFGSGTLGYCSIPAADVPQATVSDDGSVGLLSNQRSPWRAYGRPRFGCTDMTDDQLPVHDKRAS